MQGWAGEAAEGGRLAAGALTAELGYLKEQAPGNADSSMFEPSNDAGFDSTAARQALARAATEPASLCAIVGLSRQTCAAVHGVAVRQAQLTVAGQQEGLKTQMIKCVASWRGPLRTAPPGSAECRPPWSAFG